MEVGFYKKTSIGFYEPPKGELMDDTFGLPAQQTPKAGKRTLPPARSATQTNPVNGVNDNQFAAVQEEGRLQQSISIGRKPETYMCEPDEIESLRPSEEEMKNG
jgi:hypothetical protein